MKQNYLIYILLVGALLTGYHLYNAHILKGQFVPDLIAGLVLVIVAILVLLFGGKIKN